MNDIAFKVIIKNDGIDDVIFKTLMLKGEKGDKGDTGGAEIDDTTTSSTKTWSSNKIRNEIDAKPDNLSELDDVDLDSISDEQLLGYNFTTGKWKNKSIDASTLKYDANSSIKNKIDEKANTADLATVATSGEYNDLSNKPTIPSAQVNSDWNATSGVAEILNKPTIPPAQVNADWNASSGVAEILNKPTIPTNAVQLPISESDTTNTKNYIDKIKPQTYRVIGKIFDAISGTFEGVGTAVITLSGGIARIDFTVRVTVADTTDRGQWGLNSNYFSATTGKTITAQQGGVISYYKPDGTANYDRQGFGGCMTTVSATNYWKPARIYKASSNPDTYATGSWGNNLFPVDTVITGTCFGTYT